MTTNKHVTTDLTADDFNRIRNNVRTAMLHRGIDPQQVNQLLSAYRTMQPVFSAATKLYKNTGTKQEATIAVDKAVAYLKGEYSPTDVPF